MLREISVMNKMLKKIARTGFNWLVFCDLACLIKWLTFILKTIQKKKQNTFQRLPGAPTSVTPTATLIFNFRSNLKWRIVKGGRTCQKQTFISRKRCKVVANIFYSFLPTLSVWKCERFSHRLVQTMFQSRRVWKFRNHIRITFALKSIEKL